MTDKQIIIDDQKKTIHRLQDECTEKTNAIIALGEQLQRKEQECEELKKANLHIENNREHKANKLNRIEKLILACTTGYTDEFIQELLVILHEAEPVSFENKYLQTLTEIKEFVENEMTQNGDTYIILHKISECEVGK